MKHVRRPCIPEVRHRFRIVLDLSFDQTSTVHFRFAGQSKSSWEIGRKCSAKTFEPIPVRLNLVSEFCMITTNLLIGRPINSARIASFHLTQFCPTAKYIFIAFSLQCIEWYCGKQARQHYCVVYKENVCAPRREMVFFVLRNCVTVYHSNQ